MYPKEYINYLVHFHGDRDYFECHEILEEYWKSVDVTNKESVWVGLIQLAVGCYHHRRGNFKGAIKTYKKSHSILTKEKTQVHTLGINYDQLAYILKDRLASAESDSSYESINIPISDESLLNHCKLVCQNKGFVWGQKSKLSDDELVHRHSKRDRTDVINERLKALSKRK